MFDEKLKYDEKLKDIVWRKSNKPAGCKNIRNYIRTKINGKSYPNHHLVWALFNNKLPKELDHIDGNRSNNDINNLREVDHRTNMTNKDCHRNGNLPGATYQKHSNTWFSRIRVGKKSIYLGCFRTESDASNAYFKFKEIL